jgi:two-component system, chemotaxis family, sensor kinase CheA
MSDYNDEAFLNELRATFRVEAQEHLQNLATCLIELESTDNAERQAPLIETIFRDVHSLKGAARAVDNRTVESLCQSMENVLSALKHRRIEFRLELADLLHAAMDALAQLLTASADDPPPPSMLALCGGLDSAALGSPPPAKKTPAKTALQTKPPVIASPEAQSLEAQSLKTQLPENQPPESQPLETAALHTATPQTNADDPSSPRNDLPSIDKDAVLASAVKKMASDIVKNSTENIVKNAAENNAETTRMKNAGAANSGRVDADEAAPATAPATKTTHPDEHNAATETVRIATAKLDLLLRQAEGLLAAKLSAEQRVLDIEEIAATMAALQKARPLDSQSGAALAPRRLNELFARQDAALQTLSTQFDRLAHAAQSDWQLLTSKVDQLLDEIKKISMLPAASALKIFPKLVRDLARASAKDVVLNFSGGDIEVDRRMLEEVRDPLIHLIRNCIDHGIETPAVRQRLGKPAQGTVTLTISQCDGGRIEIVVGDDGAGIDLDKVRGAAQRLQLLSATELARADAATLTALVFQSGVSTSPMITDISGRGLGLAIVREKVEKLGGTIALQTQFGSGTQFRLVLPIALATYRGVHVRCGARNLVFPTAQVERVITVPRDAIKNVENRAAVIVQGRVIAVVGLADLLALPAGDSTDRVALVIGCAGATRIAFSVDEVIDEQEVLVKGLGEQLQRVRNIAGAARLRSGAVALILNMTDLLKSALHSGGPAVGTAEAAPGTARKSILVAEDSITSRMLLKGILESVGYRVTVAVDGEDAFARLRAESFDLLVSDVDMPRLSGLELTAKIRADANLATLPVVLVTTLASVADRERGAEVGANAYLVKSSFEQSNLLEIVRRLL